MKKYLHYVALVIILVVIACLSIEDDKSVPTEVMKRPNENGGEYYKNSDNEIFRRNE